MSVENAIDFTSARDHPERGASQRWLAEAIEHAFGVVPARTATRARG
jgi:hypothetical protein